MKKNLLICFDAFGTIFTPRRAIFEQYGDAARSFGLSGFTDDEVASAFKQAFKQESKNNPNYGKATGLGAAAWWTNIIHNTFEPLIRESGQKIPQELAPTLLHRFASKDGYSVFPDAYEFLKRRPRTHSTETNRTIVGVITNSDDRVPDILSSLDVTVGPVRFGTPVEEYPRETSEENEPDVDFAIMSYDVGFEKPHRRIFDAATDTLRKMLAVGGQEDSSMDDWTLLYIGDELEKDAQGSMDAGWDAVLMDREGQYSSAAEDHPGLVVLKDFNSLSRLLDGHSRT